MIAPRKALKGTMVVALSALTVVSMTACGGTEYDPAKDPKISELVARGFKDPILSHNGSGVDTYNATIGTCRIRLTVNDDTGKVVAHQGDTQIPDANASLLEQLDEFQHCLQKRDTKE